MTSQESALEKFATELRVFHAAAVSAVYAAELLLSSLTPVDSIGESNTGCTHPRGARVVAPVSGQTERFYCRQCKETLNGIEEV